jgi:hypothetical protein
MDTRCAGPAADGVGGEGFACVRKHYDALARAGRRARVNTPAARRFRMNSRFGEMKSAREMRAFP